VTALNGSAPTVLLVEDDQFIRLSTSDVLRDYGWSVIEADCASAAVAALESGEPVDLVFSDIQMPGEMNGVGLARWLRQHRPAIRVLLTSGGVHSVDPTICDGPLIPKPYRPDELVERIRQYLRPTGTLGPRYGNAKGDAGSPSSG